MGFMHEYPYTDFHELNLDWILAKIREFQTEIENIREGILEDAKAYTDQAITDRLAGVEAEFAQFKREVNLQLAGFSDELSGVERAVRDALAAMEDEITHLSDEIEAFYLEAQQYTNLAIEQNNEYLIRQIREGLGAITVMNYFTGEEISIQDMFDYLASLHATNAIPVNVLIARNLDVDHIISLNATCTDIAMNGNTVLV